MFKSRIALILLLFVAAAGAVVLRTVAFGGAHTIDHRAVLIHASSATRVAPGNGIEVRFNFLARQNSNRCSLQAAALMTMPDTARLQGSCCFPMNRLAYRSQVRGLLAYARIAQIPRDPYDVPVSLARRLFAYDQAIRLTSSQAQTYADAMRLSREKGPCCCHCWRWTAFRGLSKFLIADGGWRPAGLAHVIDLVEGCGGPTSS